VVDIGRDDGPAARDLVADEFRCDEIRDLGAEALAVARQLVLEPGATQILTDGDVFHCR
jgi:hypothetical protein